MRQSAPAAGTICVVLLLPRVVGALHLGFCRGDLAFHSGDARFVFRCESAAAAFKAKTFSRQRFPTQFEFASRDSKLALRRLDADRRGSIWTACTRAARLTRYHCRPALAACLTRQRRDTRCAFRLTLFKYFCAARDAVAVHDAAVRHLDLVNHLLAAYRQRSGGQKNGTDQSEHAVSSHVSPLTVIT